MIKRIIKQILGFSIPNQSLSIYKTLLFNFTAFGFKGLFILPIYVYQNTRIYRVGCIKMRCPMKRGLLKIGELDYKSQGKTKFLNAGTIEIFGPVEIGGASIIENYGKIIFHGDNRLGDGCNIFIRESLTLGIETRIGFHSFIMDSDDHFTIDVETKQIGRNTKGIELGKYNWMGNTTFIKKGVKTPDYFIVASPNALLTKDYTSMPPYSVVGGSPVKLLKSGIRRIYNGEIEAKLNKHFKATLDNTVIWDVETKDLDMFCKQ